MSVESINEDEWQTLKNHEDYEININYPRQIKRKSTDHIYYDHYFCLGFINEEEF